MTAADFIFGAGMFVAVATYLWAVIWSSRKLSRWDAWGVGAMGSFALMMFMIGWAVFVGSIFGGF